jgi:hypothetical protein
MMERYRRESAAGVAGHAESGRLRSWRRPISSRYMRQNEIGSYLKDNYSKDNRDL